MTPAVRRFEKCVACGTSVAEEYQKDGWKFVKEVSCRWNILFIFLQGSKLSYVPRKSFRCGWTSTIRCKCRYWLYRWFRFRTLFVIVCTYWLFWVSTLVLMWWINSHFYLPVFLVNSIFLLISTETSWQRKCRQLMSSSSDEGGHECEICHKSFAEKR